MNKLQTMRDRIIEIAEENGWKVNGRIRVP